MQNNKSPGNDGLTKEFYVTFWEEIKSVFTASLKYTKSIKKLSVSQRQAIIKLLEKKDRDKRFLKNWRPISLLNVDLKILSKALASRLKPVLPSLINYNQTAYVSNRVIGEGGRLISDIIEISNIFNISGYLLAMDLEKAFDSLNHKFLISVLQQYGFGENFVDWIKILLFDQESCIINGGHTTKYFNLEGGARQGDPISPYLFILTLEVLFIMIKTNQYLSMTFLKIFNHTFLYSAYADDTTFFLKNLDSAKELLKSFDLFSLYSGLRPNLTKCEIAGIGVKRGDNVALCGIKCFDLIHDTIKVLDVHLSYDKKLQSGKNFRTTVSKILNTLKVWRIRKLSLEGKITVFKTLAISKIIYLSFLTVVPNAITDELIKIQKSFLWSNSKPKIKHVVLTQDFKYGGLKSVDVPLKIISLQCSWIKRLFDDNYHEWKVIPSHLTNKYLGKDFKFHSNLSFKKSLLNYFPCFYREIFAIWSNSLSSTANFASAISSQYLWYNSNIQIDHKPVYLKEFSEKNINFVSQLFNEIGRLKPWEDIKTCHSLSSVHYFKWVQLINAIPEKWKKCFIQDQGACSNLTVLDHHLIRNYRVCSLDKLNSKELYSMLVDSQKLLNPHHRNISMKNLIYYVRTGKKSKNLFLPICVPFSTRYLITFYI